VGLVRIAICGMALAAMAPRRTMATEAQVNANRQYAKMSSGRKTEDCMARVRLNVLMHGERAKSMGAEPGFAIAAGQKPTLLGERRFRCARSAQKRAQLRRFWQLLLARATGNLGLTQMKKPISKRPTLSPLIRSDFRI
jgi:hypothetical protein